MPLKEFSMIVSVSRRTDIPSFYFDWFLNRLKAGWLMVRNPHALSSVSRITLSPETVECIVFWTKNPEPMLEKLGALEPYPYYIQFTVNLYGKEIEGNIPDLEKRIALFQEFSRRLGKDRLVWRYSPVLLNSKYTVGYHSDMFKRLSGEFAGYTSQCKLSFLDMYSKIAPRMASLGIAAQEENEIVPLARHLAALAAENGIAVSACGKADLSPAGIPASGCIDGELIRKLTGKHMKFRKDPGQRAECNCAESVDIGSYHTCLNGCAYCYANHSHAHAVKKAADYDPQSPFLCDAPRPGDKVTERKIRLHVKPQQGKLPL